MTVVAFAGAVEGYGWQNRLRRLGVHGICLKDTSFRWYLDGADGTGSEHAMLEVIKDHIERAGNPRLGVLGQSAGGYAALKYGPVLGADVICTFCPQTHSLTQSKMAGKLQQLPDALPDVREGLKDRSGKQPQIDIFVSMSEDANPPEAFLWDDHAHIFGLEDIPGLMIHIVDYDRHAVAVHLSKTGMLQKVLEQVFGLQDHNIDLDQL